MRDHSSSERLGWYAFLIALGILPSHRLRTPFRTVSYIARALNGRVRHWFRTPFVSSAARS